LLKARFLRGELGPGELRRRARFTALKMGILYGLLMALLMGAFAWFEGDRAHFVARATAQGAWFLLIGGPLFGPVMYWSFLRAPTERLIRLVAESGAQLRPLPAIRHGQCPTCAAENTKVWDQRHPAMLHWRWNPGLAVNELAFGQRIPERMEACRECGTWFVRCAACDRSIDTAGWSARDAIGRWSGLACPECGNDIPCQRNALAGLLEGAWQLVRPRRA
jgi:hypothetical protein